MATWTPKVPGQVITAAHINALQTGKVDSDGTASPTFTDILVTNAPIWTRKGAVLYPIPGVGGQTLEPTIIPPEGDPVVLTAAPLVWKMWYSMSGGIAYAESLDGIVWYKYNGGVDVVHDCYRSFVVKNAGTYHLYCSPAGDTQLDHYTSADGVTFVLAHTAVISGTRGGLNPAGTNNNSSGVMIGGTLYLFVEESYNGIALYTSPDFYTFTFVDLVIPDSATYGHQGPSTPQLVGSTWYMWVGTMDLPVPPNHTIYIDRFSAPAITGPWTYVCRELTPGTNDEGVNTLYAEVVDPEIIEVSGKTYLYYSANQGTVANPQLYQIIKLAVADMPLTDVIQSVGGDTDWGTESRGQQPGLEWDYALNTFKDIVAQSVTTTGTITTGSSGDLTSGRNIAAAVDGFISWIARLMLSSSASGKLTILNWDWSRGVQFDLTVDGICKILSLGGVDDRTIQAAKIKATGLPSYATDALAGTGGLTTGDFYTVTGTSPLQIAQKI